MVHKVSHLCILLHIHSQRVSFDAASEDGETLCAGFGTMRMVCEGAKCITGIAMFDAKYQCGKCGGDSRDEPLSGQFPPTEEQSTPMSP